MLLQRFEGAFGNSQKFAKTTLLESCEVSSFFRGEILIATFKY